MLNKLNKNDDIDEATGLKVECIKQVTDG